MRKRSTRYILSLLVLGCFACLPALAMADDGKRIDQKRIDHFEGLPAETLPEALYHLQVYNAKLAAMLTAGLSAEDMGNIHSMSYTMENALQTITEEVRALADTLEQVHLGSENMAYDEVVQAAKDYLIASEALFGR